MQCVYCTVRTVFHIKLARLHGEIKKGFLITRAQKGVDLQRSHFQCLLEDCALIVPKTINETKFLP
jgi:hypothetical protein